MINKKYRICCLLSLFLPILSATVYAWTFIENLDSMWIDIATFSKNKSISRYETARLLNAANCEDCIQAPDWMKQTYSREFRDNFKKIDWKYFEDINYESAIWNNKSYYYCVAYVWENWYMAGYPITSSKCKGKFCWQDPVTSPEFYNIVFNVIQDEIREKYIIDRWQAKTWLKKLKSSSLQMKVLTQTDIDIIKNSEDKKDYAKTNEEFQAWMKYCMYNLSQCGFQPFWIIWTWYWPVSELNILYKEWIITYDEAKNIAKYENVDWETALHVFSTVRDNYKNCVTNTDYDCDWIENWRDNCPYEYNPSQYDLDEDGAWNVCDDDIDWDNKKNKIWIVDDNNNIVISLWDNKLDTTPLGNQSRWFTFFINVDSISRTSPTTVKVTPLTNWNIDSIELDRWDWNIQKSRNGNSISHIFQSPGTYTLKAIAKSKEWYESFAMNKIFIAQESSEKYALNILPNFIFKNWKIDYTFSPLYSGNIDKIVRNVNDTQEEAKKPTESFKISLQEDWIYVINAKWYKNNELKSLAMLTINQDGSPHFASMSVIPWSIGENTTIKTNLIWLSENNVDYIDINRWNETTNSLETEHNYIYNSVWIKAVQQKVSLKNWNILYAISTFFVENSLLNQSHAINITWNRLVYNPNEKLSLRLNIYPKSPVLSLYTNYFAWQKNYVLNPDESDMAINRSYPSAWNMILTNSVMINKCVSLLNQWTVHINSVDVCENALKNKTLSKYKCDMDKDWIPDICDDDIDWDGKKNLLWIITKENADCSINSQNINYEIFRKEFWVCSLDNCPFQINSDQSDLNNNGIGEACDSNSLQLLWYSNFSEDSHNALSLNSKDRDQDWIPDSIDQCPDVPWNLINWCIDLDFNSCRTSSKCGNWQVDEWETCLNCPMDAGVCCWNWKLEKRENCETCPEDAGVCGQCWNWKIDKWETCKNCPEDVWECTAFCGNWEIEAAETCENCEKDVWECSATCWNWKIEPAETCENCKKDVKQCRKDTCWDGKVDAEAGEECDAWKENGRNKECTKMCTKYDPKKPDCWNGEIDKWEDCKTCPVDLWDKCVKEWDKPECWNWKIEKWETCKNCSEDVWECTAFCGNWEIEAAETCENCEKDVWGCSATCWNWKIEPAETCENCKKDVKQCKKDTCWDRKIDRDAWEECDNWKNNGKDKKCTENCKIYDPSKPDCGNWKIDKWEDCESCPADLWDKCVKEWDKLECGNWVLDKWEECDFNDKKKTNWWKYGCSTSCHVINSSIVKCNSEYDWKVLSDLSESNHLCLLWIAKSFSFNADKWTWSCSIGNDSIWCSAKKTICWDKVGSEWENCGTCPDDVKNPCIDDGEGECQCDECPDKLWSLCDGWRTGNDCQCDECPDKLWSLCDGWWTDNDCQCDECPDKLWSLCDGWWWDDGYEEEDWDEGICWNGKKDEWETCDNCPGDMWWCIKNDNCNSCPCEYSDYMSDLTRGDIIRAKLWDKNEMAFYNYSNVVDLENFINLR